MSPRRFLLIALAVSLPSVAHADLHGAMTPPSDPASAADIAAEWAVDGGFVSPVGAPATTPTGTRVGVLVTAAPSATLDLEAQAGDGPWLPAAQTWAGGDDQRILVVDFPSPAATARVRVGDTNGLVDLAWKLFVPAGEARRPDGAATERSPVLTQALRDIGVIAREDWGALATECTTPENDWYRFAIHHTAGGRTSGGTVEGAIQATQAWTMGGGGFCDIPYQFLVGYDGSLWEGRALNLYSGATGGGNNDGNIAVSFMGCYDVPGCNGGGDSADLVMIAAARRLVDTLSGEHVITPTEDNLRGHRQWPGNSTACPGDQVLPRLPEVRSATAHFEGDLAGTAWGDGVSIVVGETVDGWVDVANVGLEVWGEGTRLATLPRDAASPHATAAWISDGRISEPDSDTSPGETARFPLQLTGVEVGTTTLSLALVEEWVTWFEDPPIGGGPGAGEMELTVEVLPFDDAGDDDDDVDDDDSAGEVGAPPFLADAERRTFAGEGVACACATAEAPPSAWLLLALIAVRRRR